MVTTTNCKQKLKAEVCFYQKSKGRRGRGKDSQIGSKIVCPFVNLCISSFCLNVGGCWLAKNNIYNGSIHSYKYAHTEDTR